MFLQMIMLLTVMLEIIILMMMTINDKDNEDL